MKIAALAAALTMSLAPAVAGAQVCPPNATPGEGGLCVCVQGMVMQNGACVQAESVTVVSGGTADLPIMDQIPMEAVVIGGLVLLGGVVIGVLAASDDDEAVSTTTTTN